MALASHVKIGDVIPNLPNDYFDYLSAIDEAKLSDRVERFWASAAGMDDSDVFAAFSEVLSVPGSGNVTGFGFPVQTQNVKDGTTLWRVRPVEAVDGQPVIAGMNTTGDVWEAPSNYVTRRGRLNDIGESILYTSLGEPITAMKEARIASGSHFALIRYVANRDVRLTSIAVEDPPGIPDELQSRHDMVMKFHVDLFTREDLSENQFAYVLSRRLVHDMYDLPVAVSEGWLYPSVARTRGMNVAFRPQKAREVLRVAGVAYCQSVDSSFTGPTVRALHFSSGPVEGARDFTWHPMNSPLQRSLFPDFSS